jgi:thiamine-phosphate pyrophosphorylase
MSDRILDASFNRAREALRVLEDSARFDGGDTDLSGDLKRFRHDLDRLARPHVRRFLSARDSSGDVGKNGDLAGHKDVLAANCKRVGEALRSIEEHGRNDLLTISKGAHRLRFRFYDLEQKIQGPRGRIAAARLYVLLDSAIGAAPLEKVAREAIRGGADLLQLRESNRSDRSLLALSRKLSRLAHSEGALFIVNDRADIAVAADADGVHVGKSDLSIEAARRVVGGYRIVGATTHSLSEVRRAKGADYVSVGPMFASSTKPDLKPQGQKYLSAVKKLGRTHFCIGGITSENVNPAMVRVAVCAGVIGQKNIAGAARAIRKKLSVRK